IREPGHEYGTVTKRPRRIGWFNSVVLRHAKRVSGLTSLSLNCLEVLTVLKTVKICKAYELNGETNYHYPASLVDLDACHPIYDELPGWTEDITHCHSVEDLPVNAQNYVKRLAELVGVDIATLSVGPDREQTNILQDVWNA